MHIPRPHDLWKRVWTARIAGMKSCVISHDWAHIKIMNMLFGVILHSGSDIKIINKWLICCWRERPIKPHWCTYLDLMTYENVFYAISRYNIEIVCKSLLLLWSVSTQWIIYWKHVFTTREVCIKSWVYPLSQFCIEVILLSWSNFNKSTD